MGVYKSKKTSNELALLSRLFKLDNDTSSDHGDFLRMHNIKMYIVSKFDIVITNYKPKSREVQLANIKFSRFS